MRTLNTVKNMATSLSITLIMILLGFLTRKIFVDNIGVQYLGLNGLLQNILGAMSLLEGGFATSVVYNLYKPVATDDHPKILALLQLYRKVYRYIALGVFVCALALYPFLGYFIKGFESLSSVAIIYFIFLFNSLIQYFTAYKWAIINVHQQNYKLASANIVYQVGLNLAKLSILYYTKDYILYLVVEALFGIGLNIAIVRKANALYPYIVTKKKYEVEKDTKQNIVTNMKALFLHSLGGYFMHSTDNIIISSFVGIGIVGVCSNYTLLISTVRTLITQILSGFSESVGNLIATESSEKSYEVFKILFFVNFLVVSVPVILLFNTINPFIEWWLGKQYILSDIIVYIMLFNFYIDMMRSTACTFKVKSGIFVQDRFSPLLQGIINLVLSLAFVRFWGLAGVIFASGLSILSIGFWQFPRLVYKYTFKKPLWNYFKQYIRYTIVGGVAMLTSCLLCRLNLLGNMFAHTLVNGAISLAVVILLYYVNFRKEEAFRHLSAYITGIVHRKG